MPIHTDDRGPDDGGNALEEEEEAEGVGELVEAEQVDQHHARQPHVGSARHPEHGAVDRLNEGICNVLIIHEG